MTRPVRTWRRASIPAVAGGLAFWAANFAISLTPIAAEYRAALSIAYVPMLLEAMFGGMVLGFGVSYSLVRFYDRLPTQSPVLKSLLLSLTALVAVTALVEVPAKLLTPTPDAWRYFLIAALFNVIRIAALGVVIGLLYGRLYGPARE
ncbi:MULTISPECIES: hypothetical protein [Cryobacterium]|uniref:Uncharacterized protein n=1 Tax=Cryobacterium shii TaxID=1259235 RepID=A0AAQ2HEX6_9MICO|nr:MULTISPECIES: hypothetical protein [Cryobacterium]TFC44355.1 hypothetical protein E3O49_11945 [Cryobacterium shii]TFD18901.1 hypothetical protein E3T32_10910 [Cryobacterium sp. TMT2-23]